MFMNVNLLLGPFSGAVWHLATHLRAAERIAFSSRSGEPNELQQRLRRPIIELTFMAAILNIFEHDGPIEHHQ